MGLFQRFLRLFARKRKALPDYILFAPCLRHGVRCRSYEEIYDPSTGRLRPDMLAMIPPYALSPYL